MVWSESTLHRAELPGPRMSYGESAERLQRTEDRVLKNQDGDAQALNADALYSIKEFFFFKLDTLYLCVLGARVWNKGSSTAGWLAIVQFGSVGRLWGLFERFKAT